MQESNQQNSDEIIPSRKSEEASISTPSQSYQSLQLAVKQGSAGKSIFKKIVFVVLVLIIGFGAIFFTKIITNTPPKINWDVRPATVFQISDYPIFKQYGYDRPNITGINKINTINVMLNASSNLFVAPTLGIWWTTQGDKILSDLSKGYPVSSVMIFNKDLSFLRVMPLPKVTDPCCVVSTTWLGDRFILVHEFIPGVYPPGAGNYFYVGDTASTSIKVFETIPVPDSLKRKDNLDISFSSHPNKNIAALSYCLTRAESYDSHYCTRYGFAIATPQRIEEVMTKDTRDTFRFGWNDKNLYIQESNQKSEVVATYPISLARYEKDKFTQTLTEHPESGVKGDPVWSKFEVPIERTSNLITFDLDFESSSTASRGYFTVSLDGELIGSVYEEQEPIGMHKKTFYFKERKPGTYTVEFKVVPLNPTVKSSLNIENMRFGYLEFGTE